jgi:hypothetical protein
MKIRILSKTKFILGVIAIIFFALPTDLQAQAVIEDSLQFEMRVVLEADTTDYYGSPGDTVGPLVVLVTDRAGSLVRDTLGNPIPIPVTFTITDIPEGASGHSLIPGDTTEVTVYTDSIGMAQVSLVLGDSIGAYDVSAASDFSTNSVYFTALTPGVTANLQISATSPHMANGVDTSFVLITATDFLGQRVIGAKIGLSLEFGLDYDHQYEVFDNGDGTYSSFVTTTVAVDTAILSAIDSTTGVGIFDFVQFIEGPTSQIVLGLSDPLLEEPRNAIKLMAYSVDSFGNRTWPPNVNIVFNTDFGVIDSLWMENEMFWGRLILERSGEGIVRATDSVSGLQAVDTVTSRVLYVRSPDPPIFEGTVFSIPITIFVGDSLRALGFYDLAITFDPALFRFKEALDGNPDDEFGAPLVKRVEDGLVRISQVNSESMTSPTGVVDIANLVFECTGTSVDTLPDIITVSPWRDCPYSLLGTDLMPFEEEAIPEITRDAVKLHTKDKRSVCLRIFAKDFSKLSAKKQDEMTKILFQHIQDLNTIFEHWCCNCPIEIDGKKVGIQFYIKNDEVVDFSKGKNGLPGPTSYQKYKNPNGVEFGHKKYTDEDYKKLFENTKKSQIKNCITIYYLVDENLEEYWKDSQTETPDAGAAISTIRDKKKINDAIIMGKASHDYKSIKFAGNSKKGDKHPDKELQLVLAHEIFHWFELAKDDYPGDGGWEKEHPLHGEKGTPHLMEYGGGTKIEPDECKRIVERADKWGYLKKDQ